MTPLRSAANEFQEPHPIVTKVITLSENGVALAVCGPHHSHLAQVEAVLQVEINSRGNEIRITGDEHSVSIASHVFTTLASRAKSGQEIDVMDVDSALRLVQVKGAKLSDSEVSINIKQRKILPRSKNQAEYLSMIEKSQLVIAEGPAGTGKTYLAVVKAIEALLSGAVDRIVLSRPAVEAGEQLGFLPGDLREKVDPYLRPLFDVLNEMLPPAQVVKRLECGEIEVAPLAFMRGRTLNNAFVILDEAQNTTAIQMKMFLTRIGPNSRVIVTGDLSQIDLPPAEFSGLTDAIAVLANVKGISFISFDHKDVVRHPLVMRIVNAYEKSQKSKNSG